MGKMPEDYISDLNRPQPVSVLNLWLILIFILGIGFALGALWARVFWH